MRIGELAKHIGISADWLRRQERTGNIPAAQRDRNGHRRYDDDDVDRIRRFVFDGSSRRRTSRLEGTRAGSRKVNAVKLPSDAAAIIGVARVAEHRP